MERRHIMDNGRRDKNKNERRIDHLMNLVEKSTRTQRHLEEHSDISSSSPENIQHAKEKQKERKEEINNLKILLQTVMIPAKKLT